MGSVSLFFEQHSNSFNPEAMSNQERHETSLASRMRRGDGVHTHWPHVAFLPNAGLAAYATWSPTLEQLAEANVRLPTVGFL